MHAKIKETQDKMGEWHKKSKEEKDQTLPEYRELQKKLNKQFGALENEINKSYKTIHIHKVSCPEDVYRKCREWFFSFLPKDDNLSYGFWYWGEQIFIPEYFFDLLEIISVDTKNVSELIGEISDSTRKPRYPSSIYKKNV